MAPTDDLTSALVEAELDGDRLTDNEIMAFLTLMVVAGNETTTKLLGNALFHLSAHPDQRAAVLAADGADLVAPWVEETLRHDNSTQMLARYVTADVELHGRTMPAGSKLLLLIGAANRDERVFTEPSDYDIHRSKDELSDSLAFGTGRHFCLGANLARLEARMVLSELVRRVEHFEVHADRAVRVHSVSVRGFAPAAGDVHGAELLMGKYEQPDPAPGGRRGCVVRHRRRDRPGPGGGGLPGRAGCASASSSARSSRPRSAPPGGEAVAHRLDVTDDESVSDFAAKAAADLGDIEVVISNAALIGPGALLETDEERLRERARRQPARAAPADPQFVPGMVERQRGDIVFVSSDVALRPRPFMGGYSATKAGLEGLVGSLQMELEGTGVRASIVRPGPTWSEMGMDWDADAAAMVLNQWVKWGHARHSHFLKARAIADAITTVVSAPRGVHISPVDVNPEAPVEDQ